MLVITLLRRSMALWTLGYPDAAVADTDHALRDAREIGHAATLLIAFIAPIWTYPNCGNYAAANGPINELVALAEEKDASYWKALGMLAQGSLLALTGKAVEAVPMLTSGLTALRSMGAILHLPWFLLSLTRAYGELGLFDSAWRCIGEAMTTVETTKESGSKLRSTAPAAKSHCSRPIRMQRKPKPTSSARSRSHANNKQNPGNSAPP